ncbi:hypothetical protein L211DRAFT_899492 [Terfezia boudieri ATCC MYA-4762]|uniref:Uncharacterized protein n=1 Tax=Terfezia boudieri ATCC MYA-4762 TaxID=1051890 RepID=A0A3N4LE49_9PEZI|nr:hypothetical protein L211DRAFT_899492 [Terfezia boudieri ATCC MYA-4762]
MSSVPRSIRDRKQEESVKDITEVSSNKFEDQEELRNSGNGSGSDVVEIKQLQHSSWKTRLFASILHKLQGLCYLAQTFITNYTFFKLPFLSILDIINLVDEVWDWAQEHEKNHSELNAMDPTLNPKYNPLTGKVETRRRKRKVEEVAVYHVTQKAQVKAAAKLKGILAKISEEFGGIKNFLKAWTDNKLLEEIQLKARSHFLKKGGALEVMEKWFPYIQKDIDSKGVMMNTVLLVCNTEVNEIISMEECPLRYVGKSMATGNVKDRGNVLYGSLCSSLDDMKIFLQENAPVAWRIFYGIAEGSTEKSNVDFVTLNLMLGVLNNRNQQINAYQTIITIFLYSSHLNKPAIEVLHRLGICCLYSHLNTMLKRLAKVLENQLREDAQSYPMKLTVDNLNKLVGVRDESSIR